jgi:hypothetical protein
MFKYYAFGMLYTADVEKIIFLKCACTLATLIALLYTSLQEINNY